MRLLFVYPARVDQGSAQDIRGYAAAARALGHEIVLHSPPSSNGAFAASLAVEEADAAVFILEWHLFLHHGGPLNLVRLLAAVPRERRVVVDCDGNYNAPLKVRGDFNHPDATSSRQWMAACDAVADKIVQPTPHPLCPNVGTFFFHGYDPVWEQPLEGLATRPFGMVYVGHSKFRWHPMRRVLKAMEPIRERVGRIALVGHGWDTLPSWARPMRLVSAYRTDPAYLRRLGVEFRPPCPFYEAIPWMSRAAFNPIIYRPLFDRLQFVTCRTFETPAAGTLPLFGFEETDARQVHGPEAAELILGPKAAGATDKIADVLERPDHYAAVVLALRRRLAREHSYEVRLRQLLEIIRR